MAYALGEPEPEEWFKAYAAVQKKADREILTALRQASVDVNKDISVQLQREGIGAQVRAEQLQTVKRALLREQGAVFRRLGEIVQARRLEAAARAVKLSGRIDEVLFQSVGLSKGIPEAISNAIIDGLERTIDSLVARLTGKSYVPLSEKVYKTEAWLSGRVEAGVNSALARGLGPREFAAEARDWISPKTPGGVRYAALRLARTEINNAFHAVSIAANEDKPWVTAVRWHLSDSHPTPDECNVLAAKGPYPKTNVPQKPHPHCFCYITPEAESEEDFLDALVGGEYDDYIESKGLSAAPEELAEPKAPDKKTLTEAEIKKAVFDYAWAQGDSGGLVFAELNAALRGQTKMKPKAEKLLKELDAAFETIPPLPKGKRLLRMVSRDAQLKRDMLNVAYGAKGHVWLEKGFSSTTSSPETLEEFASDDDTDLELVISVPAGMKAIDVNKYIKSHPDFYDQKEWLLPRNLEMKFSFPKKTPEGRTRITATVIGVKADSR